MANGHAYTPEKTRSYEEAVRLAFRTGNPGATLLKGPVRMEILAFYPVPKSAPKALREKMRTNEVQPTLKPDWDNIGKIISDALNDVAWHDDTQVVEAHVKKCYGITPMVCVRIEPVGEATIHEDSES